MHITYAHTFRTSLFPILHQQRDWVGGVRKIGIFASVQYYQCRLRWAGWVRKKMRWRNIGMDPYQCCVQRCNIKVRHQNICRKNLSQVATDIIYAYVNYFWCPCISTKSFFSFLRLQVTPARTLSISGLKSRYLLT